MGTKAQYRIRLIVAGRDCGIFDRKSGGDVSATLPKHRSGGMGPQKTYRGPREIANIVLGRVKEREDRDDVEQVNWLYTQVGLGDATVIEIPLGSDGRPFGNGPVRNGIVERVSGAEADADSSDLDEYEVEISVNGDL
jgi:hypothetical protein